jgi:AcrR family transcriptional regulator
MTTFIDVHQDARTAAPLVLCRFAGTVPLKISSRNDLIVNMFTENSKPPKRGRPRGRTPEGEAMRRRLYDAAIALIDERGYEAATLRDVAARAGVSPALLYRYFPNKRAVVLALYDELSETFARQAAGMPAGKWRERYLFGVELSLRVLGPHRRTLRALAPLMVGSAEEGVFAENTAFSRQRVHGVFREAIAGATDVPKGRLAEPLGNLLYLAHLGVVLWWLLDRTPGQRATKAFVTLMRQMLPSAALALHLRSVRGFVQSADALFREGLLGEDVRESKV